MHDLTTPDFYSVAELFKDKDAPSFSHNKSVTIFIERSARFLGSIISSRKRFERIESADSHRTDARLSSAGHHHIGCGLQGIQQIVNLPPPHMRESLR